MESTLAYQLTVQLIYLEGNLKAIVVEAVSFLKHCSFGSYFIQFLGDG